VLRREANRVYLAGNVTRRIISPPPNCFVAGGAVVHARDFGECAPEERELKIGALDYARSSPFEIRSYWVSWNAIMRVSRFFQKRNLMTGRDELPPAGHALDAYTKGLAKEGSVSR